MEAIIDLGIVDSEPLDIKPTSLNCAALRSTLAFLLRKKYRYEYSICLGLDLSFACGSIQPDFSIFPKRTTDWLMDQIVMTDVPLTTIEILSPEQSMNDLIGRIYKKHFPAGVKTVWLVVPALRLVTLLLPDRTSFSVTEGTLTDPVTGLQLVISEVFEG
jgi:Uma2 family endonuclease